MIAIPALAMFGLFLAAVLVVLKQQSNALQDVVNAPDPQYKKHGLNLGALLFVLFVLALLAGATGAGPLAGLVVTP